MQLKKSKNLSRVFDIDYKLVTVANLSLTFVNFVLTVLSFVAIAILLSSCRGKAPKVDVCVSNPVSFGFSCVSVSGNTYFLPYKDSENYIAFDPSDLEKILNYCKMKEKK